MTPVENQNQLPENSLQKFQQWLELQDLSAKTIKNYVSDLRSVFAWVQNQPFVDLNALTSGDIANYASYLAESGISESTIHRHQATIRQWQRFLHTLRPTVTSSVPALVLPVTQTSYEAAWKQFITRFSLALSSDGCKETTVKNYATDVALFAKNAAYQSLTKLASKPEIAKYQAELKLQGLTDNTIARKLMSLKRFFGWAKNEGLIVDNPLASPLEVAVEQVKKFVPLAFFQSAPQQPLNISSQNAKNTRSSGNPLQRLYESYTNWPISSYLHLGILVVFTMMIGLFGYRQLFSEANNPFAYPSTTVRPSRILSFQGLLTDSSRTPITTPINMAFRLYTSSSGGTQLWSSGTCSIDPDQDGVFNTLLGNTCGTELTDNVFSENQEVWLEVQVSSETLAPRQRIASVAYALNSETLQGFPPSLSGDINTIPVINALGEIIIGANNPSLIASSGAFLIQAESFLFQTEAGTQGDINFAPDAGGTVNFLSGTTTQDSIYVSNANLTSGNLIHGYVGNNSGTGNLLYLGAGSTETPRFYVTKMGDIWVGRAATVSGSLTVDTNTLFVDDVNNRVGIGTTSPSTTLDVYGNAYIRGNAAPLLTIERTAAGNSEIAFINSGGTSYAGRPTSGMFAVGANADLQNSPAFYINTSGNIGIGTTSINNLLDINGNTGLLAQGDLRFYDSDSSNYVGFQAPANISSNLTWTLPNGDGSSNYMLVTNGSGTLSWGDPSVIASAATYWYQNNGLLYPKNSTVDMTIGGTATTSAKFAFMNVNSGTPTASISGTTANVATYITGEGNIQTTNRARFTLAGSTTGDLGILNRSGSEFTTFDTANGRVGIGTTTPSKRLTVDDSSGNDTDALVLQNNVTGPNRSVSLVFNTNSVFAGAARTTSRIKGISEDNSGWGAGALAFETQIYGGTSTTERLRITSTGNVGIGTTSPTSKLHVEGFYGGNALVRLNDTSGTNDIFTASASGTTRFVITNAGDVGVGTNIPSQGKVDIRATNHSSGTALYGSSAITSGTTTTRGVVGTVTSTSSSLVGFLNGVYGQAVLTGSGGTSNGAGGYFQAQIGGSAPATAGIRGIQVTAFTQVQASQVYGVDITNASWGNTGTSTLASAYGVNVGNIANAGTITNTYGVYVGDITTGTQTNTPFSFYASDANAYNYFAGNVGIGTTAPQNILHLNDANATYSNLTSSTNLVITTSDAQAIDKGGSIGLGGYIDDGATAQRLFGVITGRKESGSTGSQNGYLSFATNNGGTMTEALRIASTGNIGIGTTSPTSKLHVEGLYGGNALLRLNQTGASGDIFTASASGTTRFVITNAGDIGVGTNLPSEKVEIRDTDGANAEGLRLSTTSGWSGGEGTGISFFDNTGRTGHIQVNFDGTYTEMNIGGFYNGGYGTSSTQVMTIEGSGRVGIGDTSPLAAFTVGAGDRFQINSSGIIAAIDGVAHTIDDVSGNLTLSSNSSTISLNDNVTFAGTTTLNGLTYTWPGSQTSNYILQTDGSGTLSWVDPALAGASSIFWTQANGLLYPKNSTVDVTIGGSATTSAKFAFLNVNSGTPTASISGTTVGAALYMTGEGTISTTSNRPLLLNPANGRVGIGLTNVSSSYKLAVQGNVLFNGSRYISFDSDLGTTRIAGGTGGWATGYQFRGNSGTDYGGFGALGNVDDLTYYWIGDTYNDAGVYVMPSNNVGLGTTSPTSKLHVNGSYGGNALVRFNETGGNDIFTASASGNTRFLITNAGNVGIGTIAPQKRLSISASDATTSFGASTAGIDILNTSAGLNRLSEIAFIANTDSTANRYAAVSGIVTGQGAGTIGAITFSTKPAVGDTTLSERMRVDSTGNVGINDTTPDARLNIQATTEQLRLDYDDSNFASFTVGATGNLTLQTTGTNEDIEIRTGTYDNAIYIDDSASRVGIGTSAPAATLDVAGAILASGTVSTTVGGAAGTGTQALASNLYIQARGMNLVANGSGLLGNNYNFSSFTFTQTDTHGGKGSFSNSTNPASVRSDELIPIDGTRTYRLSLWAKSTTYVAGNHSYFGVVPIDIDGLDVSPYYYMKFTGATDTTLAVQLDPGATTITLTDATGWKNTSGADYARNIAWYGYTNSFGYTYPDYTYTRNVSTTLSDYGTNGLWAAGGISGNVITLREPWPGPTIAAGTAVRNNSSGGSYKYIAASNVEVPNSWTQYTGKIGGWDTDGSAGTNEFPYGTSYVKLLFLMNRDVTGNTTNVSDLWFSEVAADNIEVATTTQQGVVSTTTQSFAGAKTFTSLLTGSAGLTISGGAVNLNASSNFAVNIGTGTTTSTVSLGGGSNQVAINSSTWDISGAGVASGLTGLSSSGTITFSAFTNNGGLLYTNGSGTLAQTAVGTSGQCLTSNGGGAPTWTSCSSASSNFWQLNNTHNLSPINSSYNLLLGNTATASANIAINADGSAVFNEQGLDRDFRIEGDTNANLLFVDASTDRIGLGTATPEERLHIMSGVAKIQNSNYQLQLVDSSDTSNDWRIGTANDVNLGFYRNTTELVRISEIGNVGIGTTSPTSKLHVEGFYGGNALARLNETGGNDIFTASASGTTRMVLTNAGYLGLGTNLPSARLSVTDSSTNASQNSSIIVSSHVATSNGTYTDRGAYFFVTGRADTGITNSGSILGLQSEAIRAQSNASDLGTITSIYGATITAGNDSSANAGATTTNATALNLIPRAQAGTVGTLTGIQISPLTGGTLGSHYGIKIADITGGGSVNNAIYTGLGDISFGDDLLLRNDNDRLQIGAGGDLDLYHDGTNSIIENATGALRLTSSGELYLNDTRTGDIALSVADTAIDAALPQGIIDAINEIYSLSGDAGVWTLNSTLGVIHTKNPNPDVLIGGTSTASAKFAFLNNASGTPTASIAGNLTLRGTDPKLNILNGEEFTIRFSVGGDAGLTSTSNKFSIANTGDITAYSFGATQSLKVGRNASEYLSITHDDSAVTFESVQDEDSAGFGNMKFRVDDDGTADGYFAFQSKSGTDFVRINSAGNLGIATNSPASRLHVNGFYGGNALALFNETGGNDILTASASGTTRLVLTNDGDLGIGTITPQGKIDVRESSSRSLYMDSVGLVNVGQISHGISQALLQVVSGNAGDSPLLVRHTASPTSPFMSVQSSTGTSVFQIASTGNVGINQVTPTSKFHVEGFYGGNALARFNETGGNDILTASASGTTRMTLNNAGQLALTTQGSTGGIMLGTDSNLYRHAANTLRTDDSLIVGSRTATLAAGDILTSGGLSIGNVSTTPLASSVLSIIDQRTWTTGAAGLINLFNFTPGSAGLAYSGVQSTARDNTTNTTNIGSLFGAQFNTQLQSTTGITATNIYGVSANNTIAANNTATNYYGFALQNITNNGTMTNTYGAYIGDITTGTQTNTPFSFYASDANAYNYFAGNVGIGDTSPASLFTVGSGDLFQVNSSGNIVAIGGVAHSLANDTGNLRLTSNGELYLNDTRTGDIALSVVDTALDAALPQGIVDAINEVYSLAGTGGGQWTVNPTLGVLHPNNNTLDVLIGGTSTASAKFAFLNVAGGTPVASIAGNIKLSGGARTIGATEMNTLTIGDTQTGDVKLAPAGQTAILTASQNGSVGIGTSTPTSNYKLHIASTNTNTTGINTALYSQINYNPSADTSTFGIGAYLIVNKTGTANMTGAYGSGGLIGAISGAINAGSGTVTNAYGFLPTVQNTSSGTITNAYSLYIPDVYVPSGTITNNYGLYIASQTGGGTLDYAIVTNTGNIVFNEGGDASTDFRVEGDTDANLLFTDASADFVGIGTNAPEGKLHVLQGSAGTVTAHVNADDLIVESNTTGGISILTPDNTLGSLMFGSPTDSGGAFLRWGHDADLLKLSTANTGASIALSTGDDTEAVRITSTGNVGIGTTAPTSKFHVEGLYGANALARFNQTGSGDLLTASASGTTRFVVDNNGKVGVRKPIPTAQIDSIATSESTVGLRLKEGGATQTANNLEVTDSSDAILAYLGPKTGDSGNLRVQYAGGALSYIDLTASFNSPKLGLNRFSTANDNLIQFLTNGSLKWTVGNFASAGNDNFYIGSGVTPVVTLEDAGTANSLYVQASGDVGIGNADPLAKLNVTGTTEQLRLSYDLTNYASFTVNSAGDVTFNSTGDTLTITDDVIISGKQFQFGNLAGDPSALGTGSTYYNTTINRLKLYTDIGWDYLLTNADLSWSVANGTIYPRNSTLDLLIGGTSTASAKFAFINVNSGTPTATIAGNLALAVPTGANPATKLNIYNGGTFGIRTSVGGDAGLTERFTILNNGNVGIGDTNPTSRLSIGGATSTISNTSGDITINSASDIISLSGDTLTNFLQTIGTNGSAALPTYSFSSDPDTGIFRSTTDTLGIGAGGSTAATFTSSLTTLIGDLKINGGDILGVDGENRITTVDSQDLTQANGRFKITGSGIGNASLIVNQTDVNQDLITASASGTTKMVLNYDGKLGLGTSAPSAVIDLVRSDSSGNLLKLTNSSIDRFKVGWDGHATLSGSLTIGTGSLHLYDLYQNSYVKSSNGNINLQVGGTLGSASGSANINFRDVNGAIRGRVEAKSPNGDGADGALAPSGTFNLNTNSSGGRSYADGIAYKITVTALTSNTITTVDTPNGIAAGDELMIINLRGGSGDYADVGNYEFLEVTAVNTGTKVITVAQNIQNSYDGTTPANQLVVVQRVPNYSSVTLDSTDSITASDWEGLTTTPTSGAGYHTGIVAFRVSGTLTIGSGTTVTVAGKGYRGTAGVTGSGTQGESPQGAGTVTTAANITGGGGSAVCNNTDGAGGGANVGNGTIGGAGDCGTGRGGGGTALTASSSKLYLGGAGGSGGGQPAGGAVGGAGGDGAGAIYVMAENVSGTGTFVATGATGGNGTSAGGWNGGGGGGGAGGTIITNITNNTVIPSSAVSAGGGGTGPSTAGEGGAGGVGVEHNVQIQNYGTLFIGAVNTTNADLAEHYPSHQSLMKGEVVSLSTTNPGEIERSDFANRQNLFGVISTDPGLVLGQEEGKTDTYPVALAGRVPVLIDPNSDPIKAGDFLMPSLTRPGYAQKANRSGMVIGQALAEWTAESEQSTIMVFIRVSYFTPTQLADGYLETAPDAAAVVASLPEARSLLTEAGEQPLALETVMHWLSQGVLIAQNVVTNVVDTMSLRTRTIASLPGEDLTFDLSASDSGNLVVKGAEEQTVASITRDGDAFFAGEVRSTHSIAEEMDARYISAQDLAAVNATFSGELTANTGRLAFLEAQNANVTGTLRADRLEGEVQTAQISDFEARVRDLVSEYRAATNSSELLAEATTSTASYTATDSAYLAITNDVVLPEDLTVNTLMARELVAVGSTFVTESIFSFDTLTTDTFFFQPSGEGRLSFLADLMSIDGSSGLVEINGDLKVNGSLFASLLAPANPGENLQIDLARADQDGNASPSELIIRGTEGQEVAAFSASGSARLRELAIIAEEASASALLASTSVQTNATAGSATLPAGEAAFTIRNSNVTDSVMIYVTPTSYTNNQVLFVATKISDNASTPENEAAFTVAISQSIDQPITFNWWIVNSITEAR